MDYVQGKVVEPPSNAPAAMKTKYKKGEVKVKKIIIDSIQKHLVAVSNLGTSKEMYDKLVGMFKVNNANQILFLKNKLKDIEMNKGEFIQSYFMRITQIKNDLLSIGEVISDRELILIALGGLPRPWDVFVTTILNNDKIPSFDELLARSTQAETRMMEREKPSNRMNPLPSSLMQNRRIMLVKEGRKRKCYNCNRFNHYARECPHKKNSPRNDDNNNHINFKSNGNQRSNKLNNKEIGMLPLLKMEMVDLPKGREMPNNATYPVKGIGIVTLQLNQGQTIHLKEVLYVPNLKKNLVSISTMEDKGFKVAFIDGKVRIWQRNTKDAFTLGFKVDGLYQVGGSPLGTLASDTSLRSKLWHQRFSNLHYKALQNSHSYARV
eukprot:PITA_32346